LTARRASFTLHGLVRAAADESPDQIAVVDATSTLTYRQLDTRSARIAAGLRSLGVGPGDRVAIAAEKSVTSVAALYGIMRTGAAYVPIDPLAPPMRAGGIIRDAECRALCVDSAAAGSLVGKDGGDLPPILGVEDGVAGAALTSSDLDALDPDPRIDGCESDLAYILYTSGSTGVPKGVMLTHRNALSFVEWTVDRFGVRADDRLSSHAPFHFDLSVFDIYGAALAGATLDLLTSAERSFGAEMTQAVATRGITVWYSVPSALVLMCDAAAPEDVQSLRVVLFAGEVFPMKHLRRLRGLVPNAMLGNLYGPTETNVCTYHVVPDELPGDDDRPLPIGKACENQEVFALDENLKPVAHGDVGELWVRGPTVMKGYWGDPERTARVLQQNPLHERFPDPTYRTGDLVRRTPDDVFEFLGRRDHQIKVRGYRIELGEIESALVSHPAVREAAVVAVPDERAGARLIGFVVSIKDVDELELKRHCRDRLPRYMIPTSLVIGSELPHTSTGKIDRQALAASIPADEAGVTS
jgi:amino acid adenylation domain-containing protein